MLAAKKKRLKKNINGKKKQQQNQGGALRYQDTSTGKYVANLFTKSGPCHIMKQNPWNAVLNLGHTNGNFI